MVGNIGMYKLLADFSTWINNTLKIIAVVLFGHNMISALKLDLRSNVYRRFVEYCYLYYILIHQKFSTNLLL